MITRGIVEEIVSPYKARVRVPLLNSISSEGLSTSTELLNVATICTLPHCYLNLQVGDVVFIGFEDKAYQKAVVLGHLSREAMTDTYADMTLGNLIVRTSTTLPKDTCVGNVTSTELGHLSGVTANIQKQLDYLTEQQTVILNKLFPEEKRNS